RRRQADRQHRVGRGVARQHRRARLAALSMLVAALSVPDQGRPAHARVHRSCLCGRGRQGQGRPRQPQSRARGVPSLASAGETAVAFEILAGAARSGRWTGAAADAGIDRRGERGDTPRVRDLRAARQWPSEVGGLGVTGMRTGRLHAFNFQKWIAENEHLLKPPVGNKKVFEDGEMTVQVVGGPNERADYHDDPVEEFFYQIKGNMVLKVGDNGNFYDVPIKEGEVFLLPAHGGHAPRGPAGSLGLVVDPKLYDDDPLDAFEWYFFECGALVHRVELKVEHLVRDLPPVYEKFFADVKARTCKKCGALHPGK